MDPFVIGGKQSALDQSSVVALSVLSVCRSKLSWIRSAGTNPIRECSGAKIAFHHRQWSNGQSESDKLASAIAIIERRCRRSWNRVWQSPGALHTWLTANNGRHNRDAAKDSPLHKPRLRVFGSCHGSAAYFGSISLIVCASVDRVDATLVNHVDPTSGISDKKGTLRRTMVVSIAFSIRTWLVFELPTVPAIVTSICASVATVKLTCCPAAS